MSITESQNQLNYGYIWPPYKWGHFIISCTILVVLHVYLFIIWKKENILIKYGFGVQKLCSELYFRLIYIILLHYKYLGFRHCFKQSTVLHNSSGNSWTWPPGHKSNHGHDHLQTSSKKARPFCHNRARNVFWTVNAMVTSVTWMGTPVHTPDFLKKWKGLENVFVPKCYCYALAKNKVRKLHKAYISSRTLEQKRECRQLLCAKGFQLVKNCTMIIHVMY